MGEGACDLELVLVDDFVDSKQCLQRLPGFSLACVLVQFAQRPIVFVDFLWSIHRLGLRGEPSGVVNTT